MSGIPFAKTVPNVSMLTFCQFFVVSVTLNPIDIHESVHYSVDGECGDGFYSELLLNVLPVADDGGESDIQPVSDFLVHESLGNERENLYLTAT